MIYSLYVKRVCENYMSRTYRQKQHWQQPTVKNSTEKIHEKDFLSDYDREVRLDRTTGEIKHGWRELEGNKQATTRARRKGAKIQLDNGIKEYEDEIEEDEEYLYAFFNGLY